MSVDGYTKLAPGKLAALVTYLVHDLSQPVATSALPDGMRLELMRGAAITRYRRLYRLVGQDWLWFSRLRMDEARLASILDSPPVEALALTGPQGDIGLLELDFSQTSEPDLSYFGLAMHVTGQGVGTALMAQALTRARERGAHTLRVNTCSLDHPKALQFYVRNGFTPIRRAIEVFDDPRLDGTLPRSAAACLPIIPGE